MSIRPTPRRLLLGIALPALLAASGCEEDVVTPGGEEVHTVSVSPLGPALTPGAALQMEAIIRNRQGLQLFRQPEWTSSHPEIVSVDSLGLIRGLQEGGAEITATVDGVSGSTEVRVNSAPLASWPEHVCAVSAPGQVWCWGRGPGGELGSGRVAASAVPRLVPAAAVHQDVATGAGHTCAVEGTGEAVCWGRGSEGQLGHGAAGTEVDPVTAGGDARFSRITAGERHTCGISTDGHAFCWGWNSDGQLGNGTTVGLFLPERLDTNFRFVDISAAGRHTCGVAEDGSAWCWGNNDYGQLGIGAAGDPELSPVRVSSDVTFARISVGLRHACALDAVGLAWCWGSDRQAQLGDGRLEDRLTPVPVSLGIRYQSLSAGAAHNCALGVDQRVYCWGEGRSGQIGHGVFALVGNPTAVEGDVWISVQAGSSYSCGVRSDLRAYCWGFGAFGQLGTGDFEVSPFPRRVVGETDFIRMGR